MRAKTKQTEPWFKLAPEDEAVLHTLYLKYGTGRMLAVLSRWQQAADRLAREDAKEIAERNDGVLREAGLL